ncbi:hypothetical protein PCO86_11610 [Pectobacteriaceae bacterium CE70]|nr:hypothetical protein PCO86_11610 [Pectobacteriaceae bacterium CE70]
MYQGYPDFQQIITSGGQRFVALYLQNNAYYLYPDAVCILATHPLAFSLDIIRSYSTESIYGRLNFTTEFQFASKEDLAHFKQQHPDQAIRVLPIVPGALGFDVPIEYHSDLAEESYDATWYSAQCTQFLILLDSAGTQLIEKTLLDDTIGFNARLDGFVEGVSPRLAYSVEFDPRLLVLELAEKVKNTQSLPAGRIVFDYAQLTQYVYQHLGQLLLTISPLFPLTDPAETLLFSQAFLDRLYNLLGSAYTGPASSNTALICLTVPAHNSRVIFDLNTVVLGQRPLCFLLDPFTAAQQIAKVYPDTIIHRTTAPPLPAGRLNIEIFYTFPLGLKKNISIDIQVILSAGNLYPLEQTQTQSLSEDKSRLTFLFQNNDSQGEPVFQYQICVNYPQQGTYRAIVGELKQCSGNTCVLDYSALPCKFLSINVDPDFALQSKIEGLYHSADWLQSLELTQSAPDFSCPIIGDNTYASITACELSGTGTVKLQTPITQSTTLGAYSFPQFGAQQARITVHLPADCLSESLIFQAQNEIGTTDHTFTHQQNVFEYKWNVTSIFACSFRYKTRTGSWSEYVTGDQTIDIKGEK